MPNENAIDMNAGRDMLPGRSDLATPATNSLSDAITLQQQSGKPAGAYFNELQQLQRDTADAEHTETGAYYALLKARPDEITQAKTTLNNMSVSPDTSADVMGITQSDDLYTMVEKVQSGQVTRDTPSLKPNPR